MIGYRCVLVGLVAVALGVAAAEETKNLRIWWAEAPPVLDGKMDDACWQDAQVAGDFVMLQSTTPANEQTEVRACYDAEHLYVFYTLYESQMEKLKYGQPEDMRDQTSVFNDLAELFLDPGRTQSFRYQFMMSPLGTRFDQCTGRGRPWNPEWTVKPGIYEDHWTLELAIPFSELAVSLPEPEYGSRFRATPMPGDIWGINFCRDQGRLREWSYWQRTGQSFHNVKAFATLEFAGRRQGDQPCVTWKHRTSLYYGSGSIDLEVDGPASVDLVLRRDGREVDRKTATGPGTVSLPYHILESGLWTVDIVASAEERTVFTGRTVSQLDPLGEMLADIAAKTQAARQRLADLDHPAAAALRARLDRVTEAAGGPIARIADAEALSRTDWQAIEAQLPALRQLWTDAEYDVHIARFYPEGEANRLFALSHAGPDVRIHQRELLDNLAPAPIRLGQAGGEYESFQVLVLPFWQDLNEVTVSFSELRGDDDNAIPADNFTWHIVDYVEIENYDPQKPGAWQFEPDILWPAKPFTATAGRLQPVFVDLYLPPDTPAGDYRGTVTVTAGGQAQSLPIEVRSYGFNIPARNTLEQDPWYAPSSFWAGYFGKHHGQLPFSIEMYERHLQVLSRYRMAAFPLDYYAMWQHMTVYREADETFTFDFSEWKKIIDLGHRYGAHGMGASFGCNGGAFRPFIHGHGTMIDRETGEAINARKLVADWYEKLRAGEVYWDSHPYYTQFMEQFTAFLRHNGLLEMHDFEMHDEPKSIPQMERLVRHHQLLRRIAPEIRFKNYGFGPDFHPGNMWAVGWADTWAPNLHRLTDDVIEAIHQRRTRWGEKFWFYTCGEGTDPQGNRSMFIVYDNSYLAPRLHSWVAWKVRADGFLIFMLNGVPDSNEPKEGGKRFPDTPWKSGKWQRGCGTLVYPTPEKEMLPGMRLANYRDGLEDYEYFHRLHDRMRYLVPEEFPEHARLWAAAEAELAVPTDIVAGHPWNQWTHDRARLEAKRSRLAALIREIEQLAGIAAP